MSRDHLVCIEYGRLAPGEYVHNGCPVTIDGKVCPCECKACKRAWWAAGRPTNRPAEPCPACGAPCDPELADVLRRLVYVRRSQLEHLRTLKPEIAELLAGLVEPK